MKGSPSSESLFPAYFSVMNMRINNSSRRGQEGQVLVLGLFMTVCGAALMYFVFNSGSLIQEKTKLVNAADASAYAASVLEARTLNFAAYGNRVMAANTVAIAQQMGLISWIMMLNPRDLTNDEVDDPNPLLLLADKYPELVAPMQAVATYSADMRDRLVFGGVLPSLNTLADRINTESIAASQLIAFQLLREGRTQAIRGVLKSMYQNDGEVEVDVNPLADSLGPAYVKEDWSTDLGGFVRMSDGPGRERMLGMVLELQSKDRFVGPVGAGLQRSWTTSAPSKDCPDTTDKLTRRGKTWLSVDNNPGTLDAQGPVGYERWTSEDEIVEEVHVKDDCATVQRKVIGSSRQSIGPTDELGGGYSGLPAYFDLSDEFTAVPDNEIDVKARMQFAIRLTRAINQTRTSEGRSSIPSTGRLNNYKASPAGPDPVLAAVSKGEVFFRRDAGARLNEQAGKAERPNLFNPFWHARLADATSEAMEARQIQGSAGL